MGKGDPWSPRTSILHEEQKICNNDAVISGLDIACLSPDTEFLSRNSAFNRTGVHLYVADLENYHIMRVDVDIIPYYRIY